MSEQSKVIVPASPSSAVKRIGLLDSMRQLTYAWIGVWGVASDDIGNFYSRCVARGEQIMKAGTLVVGPPADPQAPDTVVSQPGAAASGRSRPVSVINAFVVFKPSQTEVKVDGLPTKAEFDALYERVDALSREVEELAAQRNQ